MEIGLAPYESCNLGHHNLAAFVDDNGNFDWAEFTKACRIAVRMQDLIHDLNIGRHALIAQEKISLKYRRLGIGITGLADMFLKMGIRYDSQEALDLVERIMSLKNELEYSASADLAAEKGPCPGFDFDLFRSSTVWDLLSEETQRKIRSFGLRNIATSTVAPVGTGSIIAQLDGSGLEPLFQAKFERRVKRDDGDGYDNFVVYANVIKKLFGENPSELPNTVVTAAEVDLDMRVRMQGLIGKFTSNSISSTINLPKDIDLASVAKIYMDAYTLGLKGVTIYRDGSRAGILRYMEEETTGDRIVAKSPDELPALRFVRKAEGRKWYLTVSLKNSSPYELFISTNAREKTTDTDVAIDKLSELALRNKILQDLIDDQLAKSQHQSNTERLARVTSLCLRHGVPVDELIDTLTALPSYGVTSVVFHIAKVLASTMPDGHVFRGDCPSCNDSGTMRYEGGCIVCTSCGYSKCG